MTIPPPFKGRDGVTAEQVLDKILGHINLGKEHKHCGRVAAIEAIEQAMKEAYEKGFLECREMAAKVCELGNHQIAACCGGPIGRIINKLHPKGGA